MRSSTLVIVLAMLVSGCSTAPPAATQAPTATPAPAATAPATGTPAPPVETGVATPTPTGFVFQAVDIVAYYRSIGYACEPPRPSSQAAGYTVTLCSLVDRAGRTRAVGIVTDAAGVLGNAYAGVFGTDTEAYLSPDDALDPLAAFLGTMLGAERSAEAAIWMKEHLGEAFATTTSGSITIATYTGADDDPSELYVEVADQAYLEASPAPST